MVYDSFQVKLPYTVVIKYYTSQAKLPWLSGEARSFAYTALQVWNVSFKLLYSTRLGMS